MGEENYCPCGSGHDYRQCCGCYIEAGESPQYPEQLMRSRYSAFVMGNSDYLRQSWHASTCPEHLQLEQGVTWFGLEVVTCLDGHVDDNEGWVEFIARFNSKGRLQVLHERSRFVREDGRWWYVDGQIQPSSEAEKIGRNAACPCGSGRKFKRCCGA